MLTGRVCVRVENHELYAQRSGCGQCSFYRLSVCVCLCLCLSVTSRCSTKTAKHRITQTTPHDAPVTLVFCCQRSPRNSTEVTPYEGAECRWGGQNRRLLTNNCALSRKRYKIDAWFLLKSNRKSYALYRMVTLPTSLSVP